MKHYEKTFDKLLLEEVDELNIKDLTSDEGPTDPIVDELGTPAPATNPDESGKSAAENVIGGTVDGADADSVQKYEQAKQLVNKMESDINAELEARIEEIDDMVRRLGGLEDNSLLSVLKAGMDNNERLATIHNREHRTIGKVSAALASLSQNLKSYL